jgi:hypothetical protein
MGFTSIIKLFMPKDRVFYTLFEEVAVILTEMANIFSQAITEADESKRISLLKSLEDL